MRIVVTGGRSYGNRGMLFGVLDRLRDDRGITEVIEGGQEGADRLARIWAESRGVLCLTVSADWTKHGAAAGPIRNRAMLDHRPDMVVAFPGGKGTADCRAQARARRIPVMEVR